MRALALIKQAAAETNEELGLLDRTSPRRSRPRPRRSPPGAHDGQFPIDVYQTGSGTSTNTNMNEVIARLATDRLGRRPARSTRTTTSTAARPQRRHPDRAPALGGGRDRGGPDPGARRAPGGAGRQGGRVLAGRQDRPDAPPGRDARSASARSSGATPARSRSRSGAPGRPRPSCSSCRSAGRRSGRASTPTPSSRGRPCARLVGADRARGPRDRRTTSTPRRRSMRRSPPTAASGRSPSASGRSARTSG